MNRAKHGLSFVFACVVLGAMAAVSAPPESVVATEMVVPTPHEKWPVDLPGLHNVVAYLPKCYSGGVPEGEKGFDTLRKLGIKTIISVDGAVPNVKQAKAKDIRYIHLPIGYNGFDDRRKLELTRATRDALDEGAVYIHCHHGKHRSAAAAGAIVVGLGFFTSEEAVERMKVSGTAIDYKGLYACVENSTPLDQEQIDAVSAEFPEVSPPPSFINAMVEIEIINDHLKAIERAGWSVPPHHPDLIPVAEAGRMADLFRFAANAEKTHVLPNDFKSALEQDAEKLTELEHLLSEEKADSAKLSALLKSVQTSCRDCHAKYRD